MRASTHPTPPELGIANTTTGRGNVLADEVKADIPIAELNLSVRARNVLSNSNINALSELCIMTDAQLLRTPGLGRQTLSEIKNKIHGSGFGGYTVFDLEYFCRLQMKFGDMDEDDFSIICDISVEKDVFQHKVGCLYRALKAINGVNGLPDPVYQIIRNAYRELSVIRNLDCP